ADRHLRGGRAGGADDERGHAYAARRAGPEADDRARAGVDAEGRGLRRPVSSATAALAGRGRLPDERGSGEHHPTDEAVPRARVPDITRGARVLPDTEGRWIVREQETPHPPETAEFGHVVTGGPAHEYEEAEGAPAVTKFSVGSYDNNVYVLSDRGEALI